MNVKQFLKSISFPLGLFIFHVIMDVCFHIYYILPGFDIPMHFLGGVSIAVSALSFYLYFVKNKKLPVLPTWALIVCTVSVVSLAAVVWELFEFLVDFFFRTSTQAGLQDTMGDLLLGVIGGLLTTAALSKSIHDKSEKTWFDRFKFWRK